MYDWLSIAMSGYVECHGFDQAALGMVIASKILGKLVPAPLGFTCQHSVNTSCDPVKGDWTCDYVFERALNSAGFKTDKETGSDEPLSSFSKVCNY